MLTCPPGLWTGDLPDGWLVIRILDVAPANTPGWAVVTGWRELPDTSRRELARVHVADHVLRLLANPPEDDDTWAELLERGWDQALDLAGEALHGASTLAEARQRLAQLARRANLQATGDDYDLLPENPRMELVDGAIRVMPSPTPRHQHIRAALYTILRRLGPNRWKWSAR